MQGAQDGSAGAPQQEIQERRLGEDARRLFAMMPIHSTNEFGAAEKERLCISRQFQVPRGVVRRAFQRLDSASSFAHPGEVYIYEVLSALQRFDQAFDVDREERDREDIVRRLQRSRHDPKRVFWHDAILWQAFRVTLKFPERVYFTVEILDTSSLMSALVSSGMVLLIMLSILLWMVGTMSEVSTVRCSDCDPTPPTYMYLVDDFCVCMFTLEYLVRLIAVVPSRVELLQLSFVEALLVSDAGDASSTHRARGARKLFEFVRSPSNVCDLLTVLPHWAERLFQVSQLSVQWLRLLRILRVSRVFKLMRLFRLDLGRLSDVQSVLASVTAQAFPAAVMTFGLVFIALVVFSALIYVVERGDWYPAEQLSVYPSISGEHSEGRFVRCTSRRGCEVSPYSSIPSAAWWTLATITTVGYGDAVPVTFLGKAVGFLAMLYGTILLGLPIGIIGSQFSAEFARTLSESRIRKEALRQRELFANRKKRSRQQSSCTGTGSTSIIAAALRRRHDEREASAFVRGSAFAEQCQEERHELLHRARAKLEESMRLHGAPCGIPVEMQQIWDGDLRATRFRAGPAMDRLGSTVLSTLLEAQRARPTIAAQADEIRRAWHALAIAGCELVESLENVRSSREEEEEEEEEESDCEAEVVAEGAE